MISTQQLSEYSDDSGFEFILQVEDSPVVVSDRILRN